MILTLTGATNQRHIVVMPMNLADLEAALEKRFYA